MQPDIEPRRLRRIVIRRQRDPVGLERAIDLGTVGVDLLRARVPLRLARLQLFGALDTLIEHLEGMVDGRLGSEQFREFEQHAAGFRIDFDIVQQNGVGMFGFQAFCGQLSICSVFSRILASSSGFGMDAAAAFGPASTCRRGGSGWLLAPAAVR